MATGAAPDFGEVSKIREDAELGEWLHQQIVQFVGLDNDPVCARLVRQVQDRLNGVRGSLPPLQVVILFEEELAAFIGPGRYIYLTRGFLHRAAWPEAIAMVVAHEMAHHDLGHTRVFMEHQRWLRQIPGSVLVHLFRKAAQRWLNGPEREAAADKLGLELCLKARYDGHSCVDVYDVLQTYALDCGDVDTALGSDEEPFPSPARRGAG